MAGFRESELDPYGSELEREYYRVAAVIAGFNERTAYFKPDSRPDLAVWAAGEARVEIVRELNKLFAAGEIPPDFNWRAWFRTAARRNLLDLQRKHKGDRRAEPRTWGSGAMPSEADFDRLIHSETLEGEQTCDLYANDIVASRYERSFFTTLAWRIVKVLRDREVAPSLSAAQFDAVRQFFAEEGELEPTRGGEHWRRELAEVRGVDRSTVSQDVKKGERLIRIGLYLFVTLAPPTRVVTRDEVMNALFSAVFLSDRDLKPHHLEAIELEAADLTTRHRKALQTAGDRTRYGGLRFPVDAEAFIASIRRLNDFAGLSESKTLEMLHVAETRYALLVPGQRVPPTFYCVLHCPTHTTGIEP